MIYHIQTSSHSYRQSIVTVSYSFYWNIVNYAVWQRFQKTLRGTAAHFARNRISAQLMDTTQIASNQWTTYEKHANCGILSVTLNFTYWPWVGFVWKASPYYLVWRMINCLENVVVIVHIVIDLSLSKWSWGILALKIDNLEYCWNSFFFYKEVVFWVTSTFKKWPWVNYV